MGRSDRPPRLRSCQSLRLLSLVRACLEEVGAELRLVQLAMEASLEQGKL